MKRERIIKSWKKNILVFFSVWFIQIHQNVSFTGPAVGAARRDPTQDVHKIPVFPLHFPGWTLNRAWASEEDMHSFQVHLVGGEGVPTAPKWTWGTYRVGTRRAQRRSPSGSKKSEVHVVRSCSEACRRPPSLPVSQTNNWGPGAHLPSTGLSSNLVSGQADFLRSNAAGLWGRWYFEGLSCISRWSTVSSDSVLNTQPPPARQPQMSPDTAEYAQGWPSLVQASRRRAILCSNHPEGT